MGAALILHEAADIVYLQAEEVAETVGKKTLVTPVWIISSTDMSTSSVACSRRASLWCICRCSSL